MAVYDTFSKRRKRELGGSGDVYSYDVLPQPFRVQVFLILCDAVGKWNASNLSNFAWRSVHGIVAREKGLIRLHELGSDDFMNSQFYLVDCGTDDALDFIELAFGFLDREVRRWTDFPTSSGRVISPDGAIRELNERFKEHDLGYSFEGGRIVRKDSAFIHAEVVKPALRLLQGHGPAFDGPLDEFLAAHEFHRKGDQKEAIVNALKAFEGAMKAICDARQWLYDHDKATASTLIKIVFDQGLVPDYLRASSPPCRLRHGVRRADHPEQDLRARPGATPTEVPERLAAFVLHLTAANIVLLMESHKALP